MEYCASRIYYNRYNPVYIPWIVLYEYFYGHGYLGRDINRRKVALEELGVIIWINQDMLLKAMKIDIDCSLARVLCVFWMLWELLDILELTLNVVGYQGRSPPLAPDDGCNPIRRLPVVAVDVAPDEPPTEMRWLREKPVHLVPKIPIVPKR